MKAGKLSKIISRLFTRLFNDESGQSTTEYILILAVVVMIALRFKKTIGEKIENATNKVGKNIDDALQEP